MQQPIQKAVSILRKGGIVAYPTDTVYGLGADAFSEYAVLRIYRIKKRPADQPLSVLIADSEDLFHIARSVTQEARLLTKRFWPGGLTLVVHKAAIVPDWVTSGGDTIAVRMPNHSITLELIRKLGKPLIGTSANLSGFPSAIAAQDVRKQLGDTIDYILDGGICPGGIESTIVNVTSDVPVILREGAVSKDELLSVYR